MRAGLAGQPWDSLSQIIVLTADRKLLGVVRLEDLFLAAENSTAGEIMDHDAPFVGPGVDQEVAAWKAVNHGEISLCVVDQDRRFVGVIPPQRILEVLLWEHDEDLARLGGFLSSNRQARSASEEPLLRRMWHRLPWLVLGLIGALASAEIVGRFDEELRTNMLLAFFVPGVVYLADAVGTQTETLVIRGLSAGVTIRSILFKEIGTGLLIGTILCFLFLPVLGLRWGDWTVAIAVSSALFVACSLASVIALSLPLILGRLGVDPAFGSGPLATVVQDLLSVLIYFLVATSLVE
jgi:magnesium transporter